MVIKKKLELEAIFFILLGGMVGAILMIYQGSNQGSASSRVIVSSNAAEPTPTLALLPTDVPHAVTTLKQSPTSTPAPTPAPTRIPAYVPKAESTSQVSSDGTKKVTIRTVTHQDNSVTYDVSAAEDGTVIFSKTLPQGQTLAVPFNTWSSDNQYFFLIEHTSDSQNVMVFQATGEPFGDGGAFLDVTGAFKEHVTAYTFGEATGWAEGHLIVINTKNADGSQGASYWYEVPSKALIQLGTKF